MAKIGFIGVGNMGGPMVASLLGAGHEVAAFDMAEDALAKVAAGGGTAVGSAAEAASGAEVVEITFNESAALVSVGNKSSGEDQGCHALHGAPLAVGSGLESPSQSRC